MAAEDNRQTVLRYFKDTVAKNVQVIEELVTDDCKWWAPGFGTMDKTQFMGLVTQMKPIMPEMPKITITGTTAEGDRVAVEAEGSAKLANGKTYANTYHFLFVFRGDRICLIKEYMDSKYAADLLAS
jgi:ketosteroid isomerase-like protein